MNAWRMSSASLPYFAASSCLPSTRGHLRDQLGRVLEERGGEDLLGHLGLALGEALELERVAVEPVAVVVVAVVLPEQVGVVAVDPVHPAAGGLEMLARAVRLSP